jgi:hypothetical protein
MHIFMKSPLVVGSAVARRKWYEREQEEELSLHMIQKNEGRGTNTNKKEKKWSIFSFVPKEGLNNCFTPENIA